MKYSQDWKQVWEVKQAYSLMPPKHLASVSSELLDIDNTLSNLMF